MIFKVDANHRCFVEVLQFFASYVARLALSSPRDFDEPTTFCLIGPQHAAVRLLGVREVLEFLRGKAPEPSVLEFTILHGGSDDILPGDANLPGTSIGPTLCVYLLGYAWERHARDIEAKLMPGNPRGAERRTAIKGLDPALQFFLHVRNACFHRGRFRVFADQIDPANLPRWQGFEIPFELGEINTRGVINDFLPLPYVLWLLHDMGLAIDGVLGKLDTPS